MCQQQQYDMKPHIEVLYENGMPRKLGKSVEKTLKKRAAAAAAAAAERNNDIINNNCTICDDCGGCLNPQNNVAKRCVCITLHSAASILSTSPSFSSSSSSSSEDEMSNQLVRAGTNLQEFPSSSTTDDSDESLEDSDTGFRSSSRKSSRRTCPMAAFLSNKNRTVSTSESQSQSTEASPSVTATSSVPVPSTHTYQEDILAIFTQLTRKAVLKIHKLSCQVQKSKTYRVLSKSTQPAHVIAVGILSFVLLAVWPNLLENEEAALHANERRSGWALVAYLGAFSTHFGAQIWMTFVSGLSLYFALPRHTFGLCQQILFPKYFAMNSMLSILTLILYIKVIAGRWEFSSYVQVIALTICAFIEVAVRLYLAPPLLRLMREKHKFEITVGSGQEVGQLEQRDLVKCPHYQGIHKAFRRIHMTVAMGNLTVLVCTFLHLHYLASKISVG